MATNIKAFKGICYNQDLIQDLSSVVCPPYDVINDEERDFYYNKSPYNFIHLILNKPQENDNDSSNMYTRATLLFNEWIKNSILNQDEKESLYFYRQDFLYKNKELTRLGFIGLMEIASSTKVFPHENTRHEPKVDRFQLLKNVKANLSPIFTIFSDRKKFIERIFLKNFSNRKPDIALKDDNGVRHSIWRLSDPEAIDSVRKGISKKNILIADGHHRFEVARMYMELMQKNDRNYSPNKSYNYLLTYFTTLESDGICIFPTHRVIKKQISKELIEKYFKIKKVNSIFDLEEKLANISKNYCYGFYDKNDCMLFELKDKKEAIKNVEPIFKSLDVAILDYYILSKIFDVKRDQVFYTNNLGQAKDSVDNRDYQSIFIMRPTKINQVKDVALCGERMPPKSTYFYPKLASGLVVHKFED